MPGSCGSWTIFVFSFVTFSLAVTSIKHCTFLRAGNPSVQEYDEFTAVGLFGYEEKDYDDSSGECVSYDDDYKDENFKAPDKAARAFGVLAALLTGLAMLIIILMQLLLDTPRLNKALWIVVRFLYGFAALSQFLTFSFFATEGCARDIDKDWICVPGPAGIVSALNVVLLFLISVTSCCMKPPTAVFRCGLFGAGHEQEDVDHVPPRKHLDVEQKVVSVSRGTVDSLYAQQTRSSFTPASAVTARDYQYAPLPPPVSGSSLPVIEVSAAATPLPMAAATLEPNPAAYDLSPPVAPRSAATTVEIEMLPDGSKKTIKTVVNPDGTKSKTITIATKRAGLDSEKKIPIEYA